MNTLPKPVSLDAALDLTVARYRSATAASLRHYEKACKAMPGGNTRTILHYDPYPVTVEKGEGCTLWDVDGNRYTDYLGEYSAGLYGHSNPVITAAIKHALEQGIVLCAPNQFEAELAELLCTRFPSCDRVRFCNSGTEANLLAVSAARTHTGRNKVMVFDGAYHGGVFYFGAHHSPINVPFEYIIGRYNSTERTLSEIRENRNDIAAVLIEPMQGAGGCIPADPEFLRSLREVTKQEGTILIFDEVMTSRLSPGGMQEKLSVIPDMTTFGKYIGGGLTFGAFGGKLEIMDQFDPRLSNAIPHAGTFNNNVLTMAAGLTGMRDIYTAERAVEHNDSGDVFRASLNSSIKKYDVPMHVSGIGSIMCIHFQRCPLRDISDEKMADLRVRTLFQLEMLLAGIYLSNRGYMSLSLALETAHYAQFKTKFEEFLSRFGHLVAE